MARVKMVPAKPTKAVKMPAKKMAVAKPAIQTPQQPACRRPKPNLWLSHAVWKRLIAQLSPGHKISKDLYPELNGYISDALTAFATQAHALQGKRATMTSRDFQSAIRVLLPHELCKHAVSEGTKAVCKFFAGERAAMRTYCFAHTKVHTAIKKLGISKRVGKGTGVYAAGVLEYLCSEVLELASKEATKSKSLKMAHIQAAILHDEELNKMARRIEFTHNPLFQTVPLVKADDHQVEDPSGNPHHKRPFGKMPFTRLVREVACDYKTGLRFKAAAVEHLQTAAAAHLVKFLQEKQQASQSAAAASPFGAPATGFGKVKKAAAVKKMPTKKKMPASKKGVKAAAASPGVKKAVLSTRASLFNDSDADEY